jgi:hypothetical protein
MTGVNDLVCFGIALAFGTGLIPISLNLHNLLCQCSIID